MGNYTSCDNITNYYTNLDLTFGNIMTKPKIDDFIDNNEAVFNMTLRKLGQETIPMTDDQDIAVAKQYIEWRVVCELDGVLRETDQDSTFDYKRNYCKKADQMLKDIMSGLLEFSEMSDSDSPNMFNNIDSEGKEVKPFFKIENIREQLSISDI